MDVQALTLSDDLTLLYTGPSLNRGPLPTLFYFALSAQDSLQKNPFNQPVQLLQGSPLRIFSITLPGHEGQLPPENAIQVWAEKMQGGEAIIPSFIIQAKQAINQLFEKNLTQEGRLGVAGLSRGAFIACHVAAICPEIKAVLGFAPLTRLNYAREFKTMGKDPAVTKLNLESLIPKLYSRKIHFYIGNNDKRVSTKHCFSFIHHLARTAKENGISTSPIELTIGPSIGYQGHSTSPEVFQKGIDWLKRELLT